MTKALFFDINDSNKPYKHKPPHKNTVNREKTIYLILCRFQIAPFIPNQFANVN
jgi:hypothetical protein